jgi:hypothetical protein
MYRGKMLVLTYGWSDRSEAADQSFEIGGATLFLLTLGFLYGKHGGQTVVVVSPFCFFYQ